MPRTVRPSLEPISMPLIAMAAVHVIAAMVAFKLLVPEGFQTEIKPSAELLWMNPNQFSFDGMLELPLIPPTAPIAAAVASPRLKAAPPAPPVPSPGETASLAAASERPNLPPSPVPPASLTPSPAKEANKYISLTPVTPPVRSRRRELNRPVLTLMDIARGGATGSPGQPTGESKGVDMDKIDRAVQETFMKEWIAPPVMGIPVTQRSAHLEIAILRDGTLAGSKLVKPSGAEVLDASILEVAERIKKIPLTLPSSFTKERYHLQVNFQIE